jgi:hypothetical protein
MKKLLLTFAFLGLAIPAFAAINLPTMSAGVYYSFKDHAINHVETVNIANKWNIYLDAGYAGDADETDGKAVLALSYDIKQLQLKNYVNLPILDLIAFRPAIFVGYGQIAKFDMTAAKLDWGLGATIISYKF